MNNFTLINADTDSIMIAKPDGAPWSKEEQDRFLESLNERFPEKINFEHDGLYKKVIILKAKNYVLKDSKDDKVKIKGSGLKDQKKEKKLLEFIGKVIDYLLADKKDELRSLYDQYIKQCFNITDMAPWTKKVTVTDKVLNPERTNEQKILDAIGDKTVQEGDKIYVFFRKDESLCLLENFSGDYDEMVLVEKLWKTLKVFENVIDFAQFPKYHLKKNKAALVEILK